jgi:hypothetical protein
MNARRRARFWIEASLAALSGCLFVITVVTPDWVEVMFGVDPDRHGGALEALISGVPLTLAIVLATLARIERRRPAFDG